MEGTPDAGGNGFEIVCMTAGTGNGWEFSADVLRAAVPLFDGVQCFVDHLPMDSQDGHSVRDVAGLLSNPSFDEGLQGVVCKLTPFGPSAELLKATLAEILAVEGTDTKIGFSADLAFNCEGSVVTDIVKIFSVDLVVDPARGGAVLRALNAVQQKWATENAAARYRGQMATDVRAMNALRAETERQKVLAEEAAKMRAIRAEQCKNLLDTALSNARDIPMPMREKIRAQFSNRLFEPDELDKEIKDYRQLYAKLTAGEAVRGIGGTVGAMYSSHDQVVAAVHDLLGAKRPHELAGLKVDKLSGIRELYVMMTGDRDFHGGFDPTRAQFSSTSDLPGILANVLNKIVAQTWDELGASGYRWWEKIVKVEHFENLQDITGILVGELAMLPSVAEGGNYTALAVTDSPETGAWAKYGAYVGLTIEMFERDDTFKLKQYPMKLATAGLRRISKLVADVFTANSGVGPTMADTKKVFDATYHFNLGTSALSAAAWEAASQAIWDQALLAPAGVTGPKQAVDARYLIVPRGLRLAAQRILYPSLAYEANITSENLQRGQFGDVIVCPEFSDPSDWAAVADPSIAPAIFIGERFGLMPEIYIADNQTQGALFSNDEVRVKARHFLNVMVADYRPLYKSNVADL
jgi:hypothetical protein